MPMKKGRAIGGEQLYQVINIRGLAAPRYPVRREHPREDNAVSLEAFVRVQPYQ
jgi:hypothetical protein